MAALLGSAAPAATINFEYSAWGLIQGTSGSGSFTTTGGTGLYTLASGLSNFSFAGDYGLLFAGGSYAFGLSDLANFSAQLDHGLVTALTFQTKSVQVPLSIQGFPVGSRQLAANVDYARKDSLLVTTGRGRLATTFAGSLDIAPAGAVPEPASWAMMIGGFGMIGGVLRSRRKAIVRFA